MYQLEASQLATFKKKIEIPRDRISNYCYFGVRAGRLKKRFDDEGFYGTVKCTIGNRGCTR